MLHLVDLCTRAQVGDADARRKAIELEQAMMVLSRWDAGIGLVLFFKHPMVLGGDAEYGLHFNNTDELSPARRRFAEQAYARFKAWYAGWAA